jgi:hypothetical protein
MGVTVIVRRWGISVDGSASMEQVEAVRDNHLLLSHVWHILNGHAA